MIYNGMPERGKNTMIQWCAMMFNDTERGGGPVIDYRIKRAKKTEARSLWGPRRKIGLKQNWSHAQGCVSLSYLSVTYCLLYSRTYPGRSFGYIDLPPEVWFWVCTPLLRRPLLYHLLYAEPARSHHNADGRSGSVF